MDLTLETLLIELLLTSTSTLLAILPIPLTYLAEKLTEGGTAVTITSLEQICWELSGWLPCSFVIEKTYSQNTNHLSRLYLVFFDPNVLKQWIGWGSKAEQEPVILGKKNAFVGPTTWRQTLIDLIRIDDSFMNTMKKELDDLIHSRTQKQILVKEHVITSYRPKPYTQVCSNPKRSECLLQGKLDCLQKIHFERVITNGTDQSIGDCSYLDTCFKGKGCKYVHYKIVYPGRRKSDGDWKSRGLRVPEAKFFALPGDLSDNMTVRMPPQWISCDIRQLDMKLLGKFSVIIADRMLEHAI
jgi:hypothetical protein